jgi:hypothetical protein
MIDSSMPLPVVPAAPSADLAVVVVNYNAGECLARCVTSVVEASQGIELVSFSDRVHRRREAARARPT